MDTVYSYLGYEYRTWDDVEEDNIKTYHECYKAGQRVEMPEAFYCTSPYEYVSFDDFVKYVQTVEVFIQG